MTSQNTQDEQPAQATFKQLLDERAESPSTQTPQSSTHPVVEKIAEYIPAVSKILGGGPNKDASDNDKPEPVGPPHRPHHDEKIEEFVRDQHRSKADDLSSATA